MAGTPTPNLRGRTVTQGHCSMRGNRDTKCEGEHRREKPPVMLVRDPFGKIYKQSGLMLHNCQDANGFGSGWCWKGAKNLSGWQTGHNNGWAEHKELERCKGIWAQTFIVEKWKIKRKEKTFPENCGHCVCSNSTNQLLVVMVMHGLSFAAYRVHSGSHWSLGKQNTMMNEFIIRTA